MKRISTLLFLTAAALAFAGCGSVEAASPQDEATPAAVQTTPAATVEPTPIPSAEPTAEPAAAVDVSEDSAVLKAVQAALGSDKTVFTKTELATVEELTIKGAKLTDLSALKALPELVTLHLEGNRIRDLEPLKGLTKLENLYLTNNKKLKDVSPLSEVKSLQNLYLAGTIVNAEDRGELLTDLPKLTIYAHTGTNVYPERNPKGLLLIGTGKERISEVVELDTLTLNGIDRLELKPLVAAIKACMPELKHLTLANCGLKGTRSLEKLTNLETLDLSDNKIETVKTLSAISGLKSLNVTGNQDLTKGDCSYLAAKLPGLTVTAD